MAKEKQLKTARCILTRDDKYFLVMHQTRMFSDSKRWGLPGGRIEPGEAYDKALIRELREELYINVDDLMEVGDYRYKGHDHRIFAAECHETITRFDRNEIKRIGWHTADDIRRYEHRGLLHAGFEWQAVLDFESLRSS